MKSEYFTRHIDVLPSFTLTEQITIIGAGAIGGWSAMSLAKMGFSNITVYDFDTIEPENIGNQFYGPNDIGKPKVIALQEWVYLMSGTKINAIQERYGKDSPVFPGIVISAVDSMAARKQIYLNHRDKPNFTKAIIDPRMSIETAMMLVVRPNIARERQSYENSLYSDANAVQERCTNKAIIYTANMIAGLVSKTVKDLVTDTDFINIAQWDIKKNDFVSFSRRVG